MSTWPKLIRDPVHDLIPFEDTETDRLLLALIGTREFQRLRRIKQLGMSELVFPGANHSRFAHSLGVLQMVRLLIGRLRRIWEPLTEHQERVIQVAALLHDLGHGPFSHAFEAITRENHEERTRQVIAGPGTEVSEVLARHDPALPNSPLSSSMSRMEKLGCRRRDFRSSSSSSSAANWTGTGSITSSATATHPAPGTASSTTAGSSAICTCSRTGGASTWVPRRCCPRRPT